MSEHEKMLVEMVDKKLSELCEHFDAVQILASWSSENGTGNTKDYFAGQGNWYARIGMAHDMINRDKGHVFAKEMKDYEKPEE